MIPLLLLWHWYPSICVWPNSFCFYTILVDYVVSFILISSSLCDSFDALNHVAFRWRFDTKRYFKTLRWFSLFTPYLCFWSSLFCYIRHTIATSKTKISKDTYNAFYYSKVKRKEIVTKFQITCYQIIKSCWDLL